MARIGKLADWINRWLGAFERVWNAFGIIGATPFIAGAVITVVGVLSIWAAKATPIIQAGSPFSYVVASLIILTLVTGFLRTLLGRRKPVAKMPRVEFWIGLEHAPFYLADQSHIDAYKVVAEEHAPIKQEYDELQAKSLLAAYGGDSSGQNRERLNSSILRNRYYELESVVRRHVEALKGNMIFRLRTGELIARGYHGALADHAQPEVVIPASHWMVLEFAKEANAAKGDGIHYTAVQVGRPQSSWTAFWQALFDPR